MITFQQIKEICAAICNAYGITDTDGKRIIKELSQYQLAAVLAGDLSNVPAVAARIGINYQAKQPDGITEGTTAAPDHDTQGTTPTEGNMEPDHAEKRPVNARKGAKKQKPIECTPVVAPAPVAAPVTVSEPVTALEPVHDVLEHVAAEIVEDDHDTLPASINDDIDNWLLDFSQKYNIDLEKCAGLQWRSACIYIGQRLKASGVLIDKEKQKKTGGTPYNPHKLEQILYIWEHLTGIYKHVPLASDFIAFSGVSREWFYNTQDRLTSGEVDIAKKARAIEESALSSALCDSRENPTGRIYYTKARLGWQETTTIQHVSATAAAPTVSALPVFETPQTAIKSS